MGDRGLVTLIILLSAAVYGGEIGIDKLDFSQDSVGTTEAAVSIHHPLGDLAMRFKIGADSILSLSGVVTTPICIVGELVPHGLYRSVSSVRGLAADSVPIAVPPLRYDRAAGSSNGLSSGLSVVGVLPFEDGNVGWFDHAASRRRFGIWGTTNRSIPVGWLFLLSSGGSDRTRGWTLNHPSPIRGTLVHFAMAAKSGGRRVETSGVVTVSAGINARPGFGGAGSISIGHERLSIELDVLFRTKSFILPEGEATRVVGSIDDRISFEAGPFTISLRHELTIDRLAPIPGWNRRSDETIGFIFDLRTRSLAFSTTGSIERDVWSDSTDLISLDGGFDAGISFGPFELSFSTALSREFETFDPRVSVVIDLDVAIELPLAHLGKLAVDIGASRDDESEIYANLEIELVTESVRIKLRSVLDPLDLSNIKTPSFSLRWSADG